jgi:hypothetical protein
MRSLLLTLLVLLLVPHAAEAKRGSKPTEVIGLPSPMDLLIGRFPRHIAENGTLSLRDASGVTASPGGGAIDLAVTPDRGFLYSLAGTPRALHIYEIGSDGGLTARAPLTDLPATAVGLVAR